MNKFNRFSLIFFIIFLAVNPSVAQEDILKKRITIYTSDFAKRFNLPISQSTEELQKEIHAIEFSIEKGQFTPLYFGVFKIYFANGLALKYPENGNIGSRSVLTRGNHFFGGDHQNLKEWSKNDNQYHYGLQSRYGRTSFWAQNFNERTVVNDIGISEFYIELLPNINYLKLDMSPAMVPKTDSLEIWLSYANAKDYRSTLKKNRDDFYKINLPKDFSNQIIDMLKYAKELNGPISEKLQKSGK